MKLQLFTNNRFATNLKSTALCPDNNTVGTYNVVGKLLKTSTSADADEFSNDNAKIFDFPDSKVTRFETKSNFRYAITELT